MVRVNGETITLQDVRSKLDELSLEGGSSKALQVALEDLIKERLLLQKAHEMGITISDSALDLMVDEIKKDKSPSPLPSKELRNKLKTIWLIGKVSTRLCPPPTIKEREALKYYRRHRKRFRIPKAAIARQIVVATRQEAEEILKKLKSKKAPFAQLARQHSLGPEGERGGLLEPIYKGEEPPGFQVLFSMKKGKISPIIQSPYGFHIFKLEAIKRGKIPPFNRVKSLIIERLQEEKQKECLERWLAEARKKAQIEIYKEKLMLLEEKP
ncbi:MAG: hypothetical protein DRI93_02080 [Aquificota bacterium]|nr:MAG: hypothetical protein DRI93_02080 [Aquificota bacterium]